MRAPGDLVAASGATPMDRLEAATVWLGNGDAEIVSAARTVAG